MSNARVTHSISTIYLLLLCCQVHPGYTSSDNTYETPSPNHTPIPELQDKANTNQIVVQKNIVLSESENVSSIVNITVATRVVLSCNVNEKNLASTFSWKKAGKNIDNSIESYQFQFQNNSDAASYSCTYSSDSKTMVGTFVVQIPPISVKDEKVSRSTGDLANLTCESEVLPLNWAWSKDINGSKDLSNDTDGQYSIQIHGNKSSLLIKNLVANDSNYYHCHATYEVGIVGNKIFLRVHNFIDAIIPFVFIVGEVLILVAIILVCEWKTKPKGDSAVNGTETEKFHEKVSTQEALDSNENGTRHRKSEAQ
ncbi:embigin isoform X2 [Callorhinchus milii]|uniref:embigin isoform X2 n=1 Tax=Callorhinchus milii TaxID=7868 RepID=UPI001C3FD578|nr:embigin isoform X2 [Callorhinchus milii]